ncbi:DUF4373 domain-containing protein [Phocaeicola dorei]|jgi:hypothetical protein|uniref:DUF7833 domain-containing protein n=1 Tax=Phocaeicola dorei CL02T12C06 TaxID=997876 RepID=I9FIQ9_9BACT|nr:DUF4373 domain-containing protein [Phocaeicola dorei]EIY27771.1 hypothetical protein HMPREF1063_01710 [Phocaeicola dorei CL02T00C15]EIY33314.1 hypothetical protein HMPREF1064_02607 [Phocaeicola dorei CL02T12C06]MBV4238959.1 DUF4373 domain-containing protein [Phocaeicola dorei]MCB6463056.1 DUF4373 domain-containing protein [Phocaeicola dorei]MCB6748537.1 DUF4373 domain-containing protein [Phocaeicola dorei]
MDYTEQFIRLNCSLMSDYKMMKLNADMKCMGLGLYLETILFLRKQQEYKHDFNELDLLADQWGATVENLQHLIKDFDLFLITEDGYFRCLYLDEVMGYQSKLSEQRAAAGSKGGRSSKKSTVKASAKATASTASAIGRGRINEGKNGDASCVDNNEGVYTKSNDASCMDNNGEAYMKSGDTPCMDRNEEIYMESGDTPCVDRNGEVYMKNGDTSCMDNNGKAYLKSGGAPCMDCNEEIYMKSGDASCMDRNEEIYMKNGGAPCMDNNEEIYMKSDDASCMDNNEEVYTKSSGASSMDSKERIYMESSNVDSDKAVCMESSKPIHSDYNKEIYKENSTESNVKSSAESMKNTTAKNTNENSVKNVIQSVDNERYGKGLQASFKQNFIREEKNRGEKKKKDDVDIIETNDSIDDDMKFCSGKKSGEMLRWECYINEAFKVRSWVEIVGMMSGLKGDFLNNLPFIRSMFKKHVVVQGSTERITSVSEAQAYFANYIRPGKPTRLFLEEKLKERSRMQNESISLSPYETYNPLTGERSYCGVPLPAGAPPRPNGRATWDNLKQSWI